jgi:hypothetical protein
MTDETPGADMSIPELIGDRLRDRAKIAYLEGMARGLAEERERINAQLILLQTVVAMIAGDAVRWQLRAMRERAQEAA